MLVETKMTLNKEFSKSKSDSQSMIEFKEIMMKVEETPWDFDQRLRCQMRQANMKINHHKLRASA